MDATKLRQRLGWWLIYNLDLGLRSTVQWYIENEAWWRLGFMRWEDLLFPIDMGHGNQQIRHRSRLPHHSPDSA